MSFLPVFIPHSIDVSFYVVGDGEENELILSQALNTFFDTVRSQFGFV